MSSENEVSEEVIVPAEPGCHTCLVEAAYPLQSATSAMQMTWSPLSKYNDMAAGLKSTYLALPFSHKSQDGHYCPAVILLSFVLAVGFLMIILSCALWSNWLPLLVGS